MEINIENYVEIFQFEIQRMLDSTAVISGFDNIMSARSYTGFTNSYQDSALKLAIWSSNCWEEYDKIILEIGETGNLIQIEDMLNRMPKLV